MTAIGIFESRTCQDLVLATLKTQGFDVSEMDHLDLAKMTEAMVDRNGLVKIEVVSPDSKFSKAAATAYQQAFEDIAQNLTLNVSRKNRALIEKRLNLMKAKADKLERDALVMLAEPSSIDIASVRSTLIDFEKQLLEVNQRRSGVEAKLKSIIINLGKIYDSEVKSPGLSTDASKGSLVSALLERHLNFEDARKAFQPGTPELARAERDYVTASNIVKSLAKNRQALAAAGIDPQTVESVADYAGVRAIEKELKQQISQLRRRATASSKGTSTVDGLQAELHQTRATITQLDSEYQLALIAEARDPSRFEVLDQPVADPKPVFPRRILIAGFAGLLVALFFATKAALRVIRRQEAEVA